MLSVGREPEISLRRPMAVCDLVPRGNGKRLDLLFSPVGAGTRRMAELKKGKALSLLGPIGNSFSKPGPGDFYAVVAGGVGISPFLLWHRQLTAAQRKRVRIYFGFRDRTQFGVLKDFRKARIRPHVSAEGPGGDFRGTVVDCVRAEMKRHKFTRFLTCGPEKMMEALLSVAREAGIPCEASLEAKMGCGLGVCLSCVTDLKKGGRAGGYALVCRDGPIFELTGSPRSP
jgi:dihydroorotate dehydrogenase electron transfer subunit